MRNQYVVLSVLAVLTLTFLGIFLDFDIVIVSGSSSGFFTTLRNGMPQWDDHFTQINDSFYVYSAYFDEISEPNRTVVRLIAIDEPFRSWDDLTCQFFDSDGNPMQETVSARKINSTDNYNLGSKHSLTFFLCDLNTTILPANPTFISLLVGTNVTLDEQPLIPIRYPHSSVTTFEHEVAACIQPLHSNYEEPLQLLEWIEFHRLLGVTHFTFYNHSIGNETDLVLRSYDPSLVTIMNWTLPFVNGVRVYGQFVAASDCVYRNRGKAKYVMTFDTDEFLIIPTKFKTFADFFDKIWESYERERKTHINHVKFRSKVSFTSWEKDDVYILLPDERSEYEELLPGLRLLSRSKFLPAGQEKFVMRPDRIVESGVHWAEGAIPDSTWVGVDRNSGFYFHFRDCSSYFHEPNQVLEDNATCLQTTGIQRDIVPRQTWGDFLIKRLIEKIKESSDLSFLLDQYYNHTGVVENE